MLLRWLSVGLLVLVAFPSLAGIRGPTVTVKALKINGRTYEGRWEINSPTLSSSSDGYLAYDVSGKSRRSSSRRRKVSGRRGGSWR